MKSNLVYRFRKGYIVLGHKYKFESIIFKHLKNQVTVPNFQRKLVWSKSEKKGFIETLHNGYPFGSILIYQYEENRENKKYTLIDGLQRYTTILDFEKNPESYVDFSDHILKISSIVNPNQTLNISVKNKLNLEIKNNVNLMISEREYKDNPLSLYNLLEKSCDEISINISDKMALIIMAQKELEKYVDEYLDVDNISIPTVFFTGDENELADVFENLNKGGKRLTKYQVFAAQWSNYLLELSQDKYSKIIVNKVIERYNNLIEKREVDIEGYDECKIRNTRQINLSEYCYGLGAIILDRMDVFWKSNNEDLANTIGYSTMAIVLNVDIRKLNKIIDNRELFEDKSFIEKLIKEILDIYSDINDNFKNILKYPGTTERYESQSAKDYQILSFFASLWSTKFENIQQYDIEIGDLKRKSKYRKDYDEIKNNLVAHYINDIYSGYWSGTGDSKVNNIRENNGKRYIIKVVREGLENTLYEWWKERQQTSSIRFDAGSRTLIVVQAYYDSCGYENEKYELEHVISKKYLQEIYRAKNIPGGTLGNLMLLEKRLNRVKQEFSIYDATHEYADINSDKLNKRFYLSRKEFNIIREEIESNSSEMKKLKDIIDKRGSEIINNLLSSMVKRGDLID